MDILKMKFMGLECGKRGTEDEIDIWKKKCMDMECGKIRVDGEMEILKKKFMDLECGKTRVDDEIDLLKMKCMELEIQASEMLNDHEAELEDYKTKYHGLLAIEGQLCDLHHELKVYKTKCNVMEEHIMERSAYFKKSLDKLLSSEREMHVKVIEDLKCGRKGPDVEIEVLKSKLLELEDYKLKYRDLSNGIKEKELECAGVLENLMITKVALEHELENYKTECSGMEDKIMGPEKDGHVMSEKEKAAQERFAYLEEVVKKMKSDETDLFAQLKSENKVLQCGKKRAEDKIEVLETNLTKLQKELEDCTSKYHGVSTLLKAKEMECVEFQGKVNNLVSTKVALEHELENYKTTCSGMEEKITSLRNVGKIMSERGKTAQERIAYLEEVVKKMKCNEADMCVQLKNENMVLEHGKRRAEDETENWKKRFSDLKMVLGGLQNKVGHDDIRNRNVDKHICRKMDGRVDAASVAHLTESEKALSSAFLPSSDVSSSHGNSEDHVSDTPNVKNQCDHSENVKVGKRNICSDPKVELVSEVSQQLGSETGGSCKENLVLLKQGTVTTASTLNNCLKRPLSAWGSFTSSLKRCKISDTSRSASQEGDKRRKYRFLTHLQPTPIHDCSCFGICCFKKELCPKERRRCKKEFSWGS